jgi:CheY-like chemotaxis protein
MRPPRRILVADDDPLVRRLVREILAGAGWAVDACADGWEALSKYDPARHAALVLDVRMPRCTGIDVARILRQGKDDVPVVIMSGDYDGPTALACAELPRVRFLGKPFEKGALLDFVVSGVGDLKAVKCE